MSRLLLIQMNAIVFNPTKKSLISVSNLLAQQNCSSVEMVYTTFENNMCGIKPNNISPKIDYPIKILGPVNNLKVLKVLLDENDINR